MGYEFLEHTADVKFRAEGSTIEEMFIAAAEAMAETVRGDIKILEREERNFEVEGKDSVGLLYNFLEEFLFLLDAEDYLVAKIKEIEIKDGKLKCVVVGDAAENYKFTNDVKAVTYSDMFVKQVSQAGGLSLVAGGGEGKGENLATDDTDEHGLGEGGGGISTQMNADERRFGKGKKSNGKGNGVKNKGEMKRWVCEVVLDV